MIQVSSGTQKKITVQRQFCFLATNIVVIIHNITAYCISNHFRQRLMWYFNDSVGLLILAITF